METKITKTAPDEITRAVRERYRTAPNEERKRILSEFIAVTGYHPKYAIEILNTYPYSAVQLFQRLKEQSYAGGYSILKVYVRTVRPPRSPAYLTLHFAPGQCAQVDWGSAGSVRVGNTRRRLSFFAMVPCHSRKLYVEFTLSQFRRHGLGATKPSRMTLQDRRSR